jgi:hypothetical protein
VRLEVLGKSKNFNDLIGNRTRDLPACSIVFQPITLPRVANNVLVSSCLSGLCKDMFTSGNSRTVLSLIYNYAKNIKMPEFAMS